MKRKIQKLCNDYNFTKILIFLKTKQAARRIRSFQSPVFLSQIANYTLHQMNQKKFISGKEEEKHL